MSRWNRANIFQRELEKLLADGMDYEQASYEAAQRTEEIYFDMADQARAEAKERDLMK